jgi:WD40 repeat protein
MQLVTSASDGLVKLWNIKDEACVKTLDNHEDKVRLFSRVSTNLVDLGSHCIIR